MKKVLSLVLLFSILLGGCGGVNFSFTLRAIIAGGAPIFTLLQQRGVITETQRLILVDDIKQEGIYVSQLITCFDNIPKNDSQSKVKHLQCVQTLNFQTNDLLKTGHFRVNQQVQNIADDISSIIEAALIFYGFTDNRPMSSANEPITENTMKVRMNKLKKDLGQ